MVKIREKVNYIDRKKYRVVSIGLIGIGFVVIMGIDWVSGKIHG